VKVLPAVLTAVLLLMIGLAQAIDLPSMKEGLWSIRMQTTDNPGNKKTDFTSKLCRNHAFDEYSRGLAKKMPGCKTINENFSGSKYTSEMECTTQGSVLRSKTLTTIQGDSETHSETHVTYTPPLRGVSDEDLIQDQKYLGSCPTGVGPGDRISQDGTIMHTWRDSKKN
jgi:hypothetical protein